MNFDLPNHSFFHEITSQLSARFSTSHTGFIVRGLRTIAISSILGIFLSFLIIPLAAIFKSGALLDVGRIALPLSIACLFLVTGIGHWLVGRILKVLACWLVTVSLLIGMITPEIGAGNVCMNGMGLVGFVVAIWPREQSSDKEMRTS